MCLTLLLIVIFVAVYCGVKYYETKHAYWRNLGVDTPKYYYFVGNILEQFLGRKSLGNIVTDAYNEFKGYNYFGFYHTTKPIIIIRNPEVIGQILINEFSSFHDNDLDIDDNNPIESKNPFLLNGDQWKEVRGHLAPCFTTNKTKVILPHFHKTSKKLLEYLQNYPRICLDAKDLSTRITSENVASCVFGIEGQSFATKPKTGLDLPQIETLHQLEGCERQHNQTFYSVTQEYLNPTKLSGYFDFIWFLFPFINFFIKRNNNKLIKIFKFLRHVINVSLTNQLETSNTVNNYLYLLQERKNPECGKQNIENTDRKDKNDSNVLNDLVSYASNFIIDGIETSSIVLHHFLQGLGSNQVVQDKLRKEINELKRNMSRKDEFTYEQIESCQYLDAVYKEVLRLHPPFFMLIKRVTRPFTLLPMREDQSGPCLTLPIGMCVLIPVHGLHLDDEYHDTPDCFNPERFLQSQEDMRRFTFLPFGDGPRKCLGIKFGSLQIKLAVMTLVEHYEIRINCKTKQHSRNGSGSDPSSFVNLPKNGYFIDLIDITV